MGHSIHHTIRLHWIDKYAHWQKNELDHAKYMLRFLLKEATERHSHNWKRLLEAEFDFVQQTFEARLEMTASQVSRHHVQQKKALRKEEEEARAALLKKHQRELFTPQEVN